MAPAGLRSPSVVDRSAALSASFPSAITPLGSLQYQVIPTTDNPALTLYRSG
jgi:hypothetical protein